MQSVSVHRTRFFSVLTDGENGLHVSDRCPGHAVTSVNGYISVGVIVTVSLLHQEGAPGLPMEGAPLWRDAGGTEGRTRRTGLSHSDYTATVRWHAPCHVGFRS